MHVPPTTNRQAINTQTWHSCPSYRVTALNLEWHLLPVSQSLAWMPKLSCSGQSEQTEERQCLQWDPKVSNLMGNVQLEQAKANCKKSFLGIWMVWWGPVGASSAPGHSPVCRTNPRETPRQTQMQRQLILKPNTAIRYYSLQMERV